MWVEIILETNHSNKNIRKVFSKLADAHFELRNKLLLKVNKILKVLKDSSVYF